MTSDNRYSHGKIYKLIDSTTGMFYIGSTALKRLDQRFDNHKRSSRNDKFKNTKIYQYFTPEKFSSGDVKIIQLEEVNVVNKRELEKIENDYILKEINNPLCLNTNCAVFNDEKRKDYLKKWNKTYYDEHKEQIISQHSEYLKNNKEMIKEKQKIYNENNKEKIRELKKMWYVKNQHTILANKRMHVTCCCGSQVCRSYLKKAQAI